MLLQRLTLVVTAVASLLLFLIVGWCGVVVVVVVVVVVFWCCYYLTVLFLRSNAVVSIAPFRCCLSGCYLSYSVVTFVFLTTRCCCVCIYRVKELKLRW